MNKSSIRKFAVESRRWLIEKMIIRLEQLGITAKGFSEPFAVTETEIKITETAEPIERVKYEELKNYVNKLKSSYEKEWYNELLEEAAYTWFNRFVAIKFMEVNGYLPDRINILTSSTGKVEPDIMQEYEYLSFAEKLDVQYIKFGLLDHKTEEISRYLFLEQCSELGKIMDFMFEKEHDYSELLFPEGVLGINGIVKSINNDISEEDWQETEIIGWLYQFYNSEKKAQVDADLKKNKKVSKENLPAKTQLFTPKWIVQYMVENSLGKLALEVLPVSTEIKNNWKYFIDCKIEKRKSISPEDIKIIDPAMGSGHILVSAFDILYEIYEELGYTSKEAVTAILSKNIYGFEIDDRAAQLATFALVMKGREKYRRLFEELKNGELNLNSISLQESNSISKESREKINNNQLNGLSYLIEVFHDAKEYGSLIKLKSIDIESIKEEKEKLLNLYSSSGLFSVTSKDLKQIDALIKQAEKMIQKYDVVIANPPYMGNKAMNEKLGDYVKKEYPNSKADLCTIFIEKCSELCKRERYTAMITMHSWMFLSSFENLRKEMIETKEIDTLMHLGTRAFEEIGGEVVQTVSWVMKNNTPKVKGQYIRLVDYNQADWKETEFFNEKNRYLSNQIDFGKIPGSPIAYWVSDRIKEIFKKSEKLNEIGQTRKGMVTADNERFIRAWSEVSLNKSLIKNKNNSKWFPYQKGGETRKWYGNLESFINWENNGKELLNMKNEGYKTGSTNHNLDYIFKPAVIWNKISSSNFGTRISFENFLYDDASPFFVSHKVKLEYILAFLNTKIAFNFLKNINPTLNFQPGNIANLPIILGREQVVEKIVQENVSTFKQEWDSRETSWDFEKSPLLMESSLNDAYKSYCEFWTKEFFQMHSNEEELNRLFIEIYGLQDEMDEKVELKDITLLKNEIMRATSKGKKKKSEEENEEEDSSIMMEDGKPVFNRTEICKQLLSYIIGCALGRYSIDKTGLIMANSDDKLDLSNGFKVLGLDGEIRHNIQNPRIVPSIDGIIPLTDKNYFRNTDIIEIVENFLKAVWGEAVLEENLDWIAKSLKDSEESSRDIIRSYFINDFMEDHIKRYNKRPIYWLITSNGKGKDAGFNALIYLHRYNQNTMPLLRNRYVNELQAKVSSKLEIDRKRELETNLTTIEKRKIKKDIELAQKQLNELIDLDKKLNNLINQNISLDLDDGVKVNYFKIQNEEDILYKIKL